MNFKQIHAMEIDLSVAVNDKICIPLRFGGTAQLSAKSI